MNKIQTNQAKRIRNALRNCGLRRIEMVSHSEFITECEGHELVISLDCGDWVIGFEYSTEMTVLTDCRYDYTTQIANYISENRV